MQRPVHIASWELRGISRSWTRLLTCDGGYLSIQSSFIPCNLATEMQQPQHITKCYIEWDFTLGPHRLIQIQILISHVIVNVSSSRWQMSQTDELELLCKLTSFVLVRWLMRKFDSLIWRCWSRSPKHWDYTSSTLLLLLYSGVAASWIRRKKRLCMPSEGLDSDEDEDVDNLVHNCILHLNDNLPAGPILYRPGHRLQDFIMLSPLGTRLCTDAWHTNAAVATRLHRITWEWS